jgi:hypothetical protein
VPRPCADKQRLTGANRTARPDHRRGSSGPMYPAPQYSETEHFACTGKVYPHHNLRIWKAWFVFVGKSNTPEGRSPERSEGELTAEAFDQQAFEKLRKVHRGYRARVPPRASRRAFRRAAVSVQGHALAAEFYSNSRLFAAAREFFLRSAPLSNGLERAAGGTRVQPINRHPRIHHAARDPGPCGRPGLESTPSNRVVPKCNTARGPKTIP